MLEALARKPRFRFFVVEAGNTGQAVRHFGATYDFCNLQLWPNIDITAGWFILHWYTSSAVVFFRHMSVT